MLQQAIDNEVQEFMECHSSARTDDERQAVVRNGSLPARKILTGLGPLEVQQPRVRDRRSAAGVCFTSNLLPKYLRRVPSVDALIPALYLRGISTGDFTEALEAILGPNAAGLSAANIVRLKEGWEIGKPKFFKAIMDLLERYSPGIGRLTRHVELLTPADIEERYRMPGGHWHHGELQADQMLMSRPVFGAEGYGTPVDGLYLCGAGSHPGGGISGAPGLNAAGRIMALER